jgi:hypothetical protein
MHSLKVIKTVAADALDDDDLDAMGLYQATVDPGSVLEMAAIIESLLAALEQTGHHSKLVKDVRKRIRAGWDGPILGENE